MKKIMIISLLLCTGILCFSACSGKNQAPIDGSNNDPSWDAVVASYNYCLPLLVVDATKDKITNTVRPTSSQAPINQWVHSKQLATAKSLNVVTPNTDTLYSQVFLDLSESPLVLNKPQTDRFVTLQLMDAYTNTVTILGTGGDTEEARTYLLTGPDYQGDLPDNMVEIVMPQNMGWIIGRIVCEGVDDLENIYAIQDQLEIMPLEAYLSGEDYSPPAGVYNQEYDFIPIKHVMEMTPQAFFDTANQLMAENPASVIDEEIVQVMESIKVGPKQNFEATLLGDDRQENWKQMIVNLQKTLSEDSKAFNITMGQWHYLGEPISEFGKEYNYRALVALGGLGANPVSAAIYPRLETDEKGDPLNGNQNYVIHFEKDGLPPTRDKGFWSITAYNSKNFLIDNPLNRYSLNDRSDLQFNEDGSLDLLLQENPPADLAMENNWLPVSKDDFHLYLRIYLPQDSVLNGDWIAPTVKKN